MDQPAVSNLRNPAALVGESPADAAPVEGILTQVQTQEVVFPSSWVDEVLILSRSQIFKLPFYGPHILGLVNHRGEMVPLLSCPLAGPNATATTSPAAWGGQDTLRAIRLNDKAQQFQGVAVLVDRILGTLTDTDFQQRPQVQVFQLQDLPLADCQPQRWHPV
ncbi:chemotaxis protein CheW [Lyngbya confervoides]|uniref:Chemotaxis protein CheW n=1 Tax=Lyngbya confervoides BDU141951 TaxID=1574623 RepID=A0ABD4T9C3_9CYAN|nr:chemotaxis protein CheW [Lyngbya confervoides]MCM1984927.1 chemotaxis protein CheW [Lyngbya confervoides BDU141951]